MMPASGTIGMFPQSPAKRSPVYRPPLSFRGGMVPGTNAAYFELSVSGRADAMLFHVEDIIYRRAPMCEPEGDVVVPPVAFGNLRHDKFDHAMFKIALEHAQKPSAAARQPDGTSRQGTSPADRSKRNGVRPPTHSHACRTAGRRGAPTGGRSGGLAVQRAQPSRAPAPSASSRWTRKPATSLMGLCNRASARSSADMLPKIVEALNRSGDVPRCVETIMLCMSQSDTYVDLFVGVLDKAQPAVPGLHEAISEHADEFLRSALDLRGESPDPHTEYDAFCAFVKDKRKRVNCVEAFARLGFADQVASKAGAAMDVLADPACTFHKDVAVELLATVARHSTFASLDMPGLRRMASCPAKHGMSLRTVFAIQELCESVGGAPSSSSRV